MENSKFTHPATHTMELWIGNILRIGVGISAVLVVCGGILYSIQQGTAQPEYRTFTGEPEHLKGIGEILRAALTLRPRSLIQLGLLVLIATPIARVMFSVFVFARQKDRLYVGVTLVVLILLLASLLLGK